jgi:hypothetical protein
MGICFLSTVASMRLEMNLTIREPGKAKPGKPLKSKA